MAVKTKTKNIGRYTEDNVFVDGNTLRKVSASALPAKTDRVRISENTRVNRERSLQMNLRYVIFLSVAAILTVLVCVNYLQLQSRYTTLQKESTSLETSLASLKLANDTEYNRIMSSVNLEEVREKAMNEFGMVYASAGQIVTYEAPESDYVKQYTEVPD